MVLVRGVEKVFKASPTIEGAGVHLHRAFGPRDVPLFDPFLMVDDFRAGDNPDDYLPGFPWHPHRGIETVTYMLEGCVGHGDSLGNAGVIAAGDIQWMTAGSGIIHQEMPEPVNGRMGGFQLWVNLPRSHKMTGPRYQEIKAGVIATVSPAPGVSVKVICGELEGVRGPVRNIITSPSYFDVSMEADVVFTHRVRDGDTVAAYVTGGAGIFGGEPGTQAKNRDMLLFGDGDMVIAATKTTPFRFLLFFGKPVREPVAWGGPIVMNTDEELRQAFREYRNGIFIKNKKVFSPAGG